MPLLIIHFAMANRTFLLFCSLFISYTLNSQSRFEMYAGPSYTNVLHLLDGQQIVYTFPLNAPLWNIGFQLGFNKMYNISERISISNGIKIQLKGDRESRLSLLTGELYGIRFLYITSPISINLKVLNTKDIFVKGGLSADYLINQNKINGFPYFPIHSFADKWELSSHIGVYFNIINKLSAEILYSQGLTNIYKVPINGTNSSYEYRHQAFEGSIYFRL